VFQFTIQAQMISTVLYGAQDLLWTKKKSCSTQVSTLLKSQAKLLYFPIAFYLQAGIFMFYLTHFLTHYTCRSFFTPTSLPL